MKSKPSFRKRLISTMLSLCMLFSLLPMSVLTLATGEAAVAVEWTPLTQEEDGVGKVELSVELASGEGMPVAAMIEISLDPTEAAALTWNGDEVEETALSKEETPGEPEEEPEGDLTEGETSEQEPSGGEPSGGTLPGDEVPDDGAGDDGITVNGGPAGGENTNEDPVNGETTNEDTTEKEPGEEGTAGVEGSETLTQVLTSYSPGSGGIVRVNRRDGSAVLRILLAAPYTGPEVLTFSVLNGDRLTVDVTKDDIRVKPYYSGETLPDIHTAPLLGTEDGLMDPSFSGSSFTILKTLPKEVTITPESEGVDLDGNGSKTIPYTIGIQSPTAGEGESSTDKDYSFTLTWPESLSRPEGALALKNQEGNPGQYAITCGDSTLATLTLPTGVTAGHLTATASGLTFDLTVSENADGSEEPYTITLTVDGGAFIRTSAAVNGKMVLSTVNSKQEPVEASAWVTASEAALPGEGAGYQVTILESKNYTQTVAWADNKDESSLRPDYGRDGFYPRLYFTINGIRTELTEETMSYVGLTGWPKIEETPSGFQTVDPLPTVIQETDGFDYIQEYDVAWTMEPPVTVPEGYAFVEVTEDNLSQYPSVNGETGWYYMLRGTFSFALEARKGEDNTLTEEQISAILNNFEFKWSYGNSGGGSDSIQNMIASGYATPPTLKGDHVTISGLWKYNLDGSPITFSVVELPDGVVSDTDRLTEGELSGTGLLETGSGDWFQVLYDNTGVSNHATDDTAVYNGGKLRLVLSGETTFSAEKRWLDDAKPGEGLESRPDVTFSLWRYREGLSHRTAAQVTEAGEITIQDTDKPESKTVEEGDTSETYCYYPVIFETIKSTGAVLPKYDADGYAYIYGVKEEMKYKSGDNRYETNYGVIGMDNQVEAGSDTVPYAGGRASGDTLLYDGGTLSNRRENTIQIAVTKKWEAAAYQSEFDDVVVELTLQSRTPGGDWTDEGDKRYLYNFSAERLTESCSISKPEFDGQGQTLEYRWVETAVYQNVTATTEEAVQQQIASIGRPDSTVTKSEVTESDGVRTFTLTQNGAEVTYFSTPQDGTIVNQVDDSIDYHVEKTWEPPTMDKDAVTIQIYQITSGSADMDLTTPYVSFSFDKDGNLLPDKTDGDGIQDGASVEQDENSDGDIVLWNATVNDLPRFDTNGRPYEYILLEANGWPTYETTRQPDGDYETTVTNGKGGNAIPILVRKVWLDDGDDLHREPVTFTFYNEDGPIQVNGENLTVTLQDGLWHEVVNVPVSAGENANDLYVVETSMGQEKVNHYLNGNFNKDNLAKNYGFSDDGTPDKDRIFDVTTDNHRYQVTYKYETTGSTAGVQGTFTVTNRRLGNIDLTVQKDWVDGVKSGETAVQEIAQELKNIFDEKNGTRLALVFRLKFADDDKAEQENWEITFSGIDAADDTVQVGGERVPIYGGYQEVTTETSDEYSEQVSSEQVIIGIDKDGEVKISDQAFFFGLPKYDASGQVVEYTVEELWLNVTNANSETLPRIVTDNELKWYYPDLWNLWKDYTDSYKMEYESLTDVHNTKDIQTLYVTNSRTGTKDVVWHKEWQDGFTYDSDLRPDIYLDIYKVYHVSDGAGGVKKQVEQVQANVKWTEDNSSQNSISSWTVTLPGVQKYDSLGEEILYYAVERTVAAVGDYDYQAVKYSLDGSDLGDRDNPATSENPDEDAVGSGKVLDLLDESQWKDETVPDSVKDSIGTFGEGSPRYALVEGGTFTNALAENYTIEGMKYWASLPFGWLESRGLPQVTFYVYRSSNDTVPDTTDPTKAVATLTVTSEQWGWTQLQSGLGYRYLIWYEGQNELAKDKETGDLTCISKDEKGRLPRYDENGRLYTYAVAETVEWDDNIKVEADDQVFVSSYTDFTVTNTYTPTKGTIAIKKFLYLPMKDDGTPEAYPAVTFQLTRQVLGTDGTTYEEDPTFETQEQILKSAKVKELYQGLQDGSGGKKSGYITATLTFGNLPLYAPDGTRYQYTVKEVKDELLGYDTWAQTGDVEAPSGFDQAAEGQEQVTGLMPRDSADPDAGKPQATFKNQQPEHGDVFESFTATKIWQDYSDQFEFRPSQTEFASLLVLTRRADSQTGQNNSIPEQEVAFQIQWTPGTEASDTWTFTIKPAQGTTDEFEKYAPNGMPWIYTLSEPVTEDGKRLELDSEDPTADANQIYTPSRSGGKWATIKGDSGKNDFGSLTNSVLTKAQFEKIWKDKDNQEISQDYLGFDLSVEFQLQVSERGKENWTAASKNEYVKAAMGTDFQDTVTLTGRVNDTTRWSDSFDGLPAVVAESDGTFIFLTYRVVEISVSYGEIGQDIPWDEEKSSYGDDVGTGLVTDAAFSQSGTVSTSTNTLRTMEVSVEKIWVDGDNQYNTRPGVDLPMTWTAWFVLQRTTDSGDSAAWENVALVHLYGNNSSSKDDEGATGRWSYTFTSLPTADYSGDAAAAFYTYQVLELQPSSSGYTLDTEAGRQAVEDNIVSPDNPTYNPGGSAYTTTYVESPVNTWAVTNTLDVYGGPDPEGPAKEIRAEKVWAVGSDPATKPSVTFRLQYRVDDTGWKNAKDVLSALGDKTVSESSNWTAVWENLPSTIGGQPVLQYQVVELVPGDAGWVQIDGDCTGADDTYTYTFTNTFTRDFTVEKDWNPSSATTHEVTVGLYRTTVQNNIGSATSGEWVPVDEMDLGDGYRTAALNTGNNWAFTFENLPAYDAGGNPYYYYALELSAAGPVGEGGAISLGGSGYVVSYDTTANNTKTTVTNTPATEVSGKKTWMDNSASDRPQSVTLILQRKVTGGQWTTVPNVSPTWSKPTGADEWTYTYTGLPMYNSNGQAYTYRVLEEVPNGYQLQNQAAGETAGAVAAENGNYNFVNVRTGTVNLYVFKTWTGDQSTNRPTGITLKLERKTVNEGDDEWIEITQPAQPHWDTTSNPWTLTYEGLPQFDSSGVAYMYRVTEIDPPEGYEAKDSTNTDPTLVYRLENIRLGSLTVRKTVSGNLGETGREFHFTVVLTGSSQAGTSANDVTGTYTASYTSGAGTTTEKNITFTNGTSEPLTLKHGESITISGLPAGLRYQVQETEANTEGYSTTGTGWTGTIPSGSTVEAVFENYRASSGGPETDRITISGTKTWVDRNNADGKRPDFLKLTLYQSVNGGKETVLYSEPVWSKNGNVWTYTYRNLPMYDSAGNRYTYRVTETVPEGYVGQSSGFDFTNTLAETFITLSGQKYWIGDTPEDRPESITVVLYAGGLEMGRVTVTAAENWQYSFENVPQYDAHGNEIQYEVREEPVPDGYQVQYDGLDIINRKEGTFGILQVTKQVEGVGGDYDQAFSFTVTLDDPTVNGVYGDMTFVSGVASITLKHGQTAAAVGLPSGVRYTVSEEALEDYTVSAYHETGTISTNAVSEATFINSHVQPDAPDDDSDNPEGSDVQTGDQGKLLLYAALTALFAGGLLATFWLGKKSRRRRGDRRQSQ